MTADYETLTKEQIAPERIWTSIAALLFLCIPIVALTMFLKVGFPENIEFFDLILRFSLPFSLLVPAVYAARKGGQHRDARLKARRKQIRFSTLEPYLEKFAEDDRKAVRKLLVDEFFVDKIQKESRQPFIGLGGKQITDIIAAVKAALNNG